MMAKVEWIQNRTGQPAPLLGFGLLAILFTSTFFSPFAWAEDDLLPEPGPQLGEFLRDLERRFEQQEDERERRLREFKHELDGQRRRFLEDNEDLRQAGKEALEEFMGDISRFMQEHGVDLEERLKDIEELVQQQGESWLRELQKEEVKDDPQSLPEKEVASIQLSFFVLSRGADWEGSPPLPPSLADTARGLGVEPAELLLLDKVYVRTRNGSGFRFNSHLPDRATANPQPYLVAVDEVSVSVDGKIHLNRLAFESHLSTQENVRDLFFDVSAELHPGKPTVLGAVSIRGATESIVLVGLVEEQTD